MYLVFKFLLFGGFLFECYVELMKWLNNLIYLLLIYGFCRQKEKYFIGFSQKIKKDIYLCFYFFYNFNNYSRNYYEYDWKKKLDKKEF